MPERDGSQLYNTCPVFGTAGDTLSKYHKLYLANTFVPGLMMTKESDVFFPGDIPMVVNTGMRIVNSNLSIYRAPI